ncbi:MAG: FAD-binding protein [Chitinophagaceae bacterium]|nr:MAG: FAD-binding protein [Chitinophagaceae bacterium]
MEKRKSAIIIGSGIAGLAAAIRLAVDGFSVRVYERNAVPGGKITMFEKDGYRFDAGPSLFTQPQNIEELFEYAGEPIDAYFSYKDVDVACKYFFENGKTVNAYTNIESFAEELQEQVGEPKQAVTNYLSASKKVYNNIGSIFLNYSLHKRSTWLNKRIFTALRTVKFPYLFHSLHTYNRKRFVSTEAGQIFAAE